MKRYSVGTLGEIESETGKWVLATDAEEAVRQAFVQGWREGNTEYGDDWNEYGEEQAQLYVEKILRR